MCTRLPGTIESYLVFVLQRHQGDAVMGQRIMALDWLGGQQLHGAPQLVATPGWDDFPNIIAARTQ